MDSRDGWQWGEWKRIAAFGEGHYQVTGLGKSKAGSMFNYHSTGKGLNWRTNLYYVETRDRGNTWETVDGQLLELPLTRVHNKALVREYESVGLNVYLKDLRFDSQDRPMMLYITSKGYQSGPKNSPRTWTVSRWTGNEWLHAMVTVSDSNYDFGELWRNGDNDWRVIGPTEPGPQPYNPGGEIVIWKSTDRGASWTRVRQMTHGSPNNHSYVRRVVNAHPDFVAIWADGHGRRPSESRLFIANSEGGVFRLPRVMDADQMLLERIGD